MIFEVPTYTSYQQYSDSPDSRAARWPCDCNINIATYLM